jgi:glycerol-3-phosphate acyltransferase PlsY
VTFEDSVPAATVLIAGYLAGSIPFGLLLARWIGRIDLREHGSRNIGATNVARTMGLRWGICVLVLDALKGMLPVLLLPSLFLQQDDPVWEHVRVGCGLAAICGHMFPCWLNFRGGKGVATALGVVAVLAPWATLFAFVAFALTFAASRIVSLSSIVASIVFAAAEMTRLWPTPFSPTCWSLGLFSLAVPLLIIARHRENIKRLARGEESRFQFRRRRPNEAPSSSPGV